ncbi:MAG: three-Cys-motif partner protein TcmP [Caldilineaceae bacterium]|nr:three-Cys-motif partner protein TcmP [Caldilineaceae bacterium]
MPSKTTTWQLEDHTLGKHRVLRNYMDAWLPKMLQYRRQVLFIDGFAGPGEYRDGEDGSPIIALKSLIEHSANKRMRGQINFVFIEKELDRKGHLEKTIEPYFPTLPKYCNVRVVHSTFVARMTMILDWFDSRKQTLPPSFVMIDPFGVSDIPMSVIGRIMANPSTEVYISFMYEAINRFRSHPNFERHLDDLFGCNEWRQGLDIPEGRERKNFFYALYEESLRKAGANFVLLFELYRNERLVYAIFFATQRLEGCDVMKRAMWETAPFGDFKFRSGTANQLTLGLEPTSFTPLSEALQDEFGQKGWVNIEEAEEFVMSDKTEFHTGHLKRKTLLPMERVGELEARSSDPKRRRGSYKSGTQLRFLTQ